MTLNKRIVKKIDVRKIFREINKRIKERGDILVTIDGKERKGMSWKGFRIGEQVKWH